MLFGVGVGDFVAVGTLAWKVYKSCKEAPESFQNIHIEVLSLQAVLKEVEETVFVRPLPPEREARLASVANRCSSVLTDLQNLVARYEGLGTQSKLTWDRMKWGKEDVVDIRARLISNTNLLTALLSTSQLSVEQKLDKFIAEFRAGKRESSIISVATRDSLEPDEREKWRTIRKDLESIGISVAAFDANREFIFQWFKDAVESGLFEETQDGSSPNMTPPDLEVSAQSQSTLSSRDSGQTIPLKSTSFVLSTSRSSYDSDLDRDSSQPNAEKDATKQAGNRKSLSDDSIKLRFARLFSNIVSIASREAELIRAIAAKKVYKVLQILGDNAQSRSLRQEILDIALLKAIECGWPNLISPLIAAGSSTGIIWGHPDTERVKDIGSEFYREYFAQRPYSRSISRKEFEESLRVALTLPCIIRVLSIRDSLSSVNPAQAVLHSTVADGSINQKLLHLLIAYDANINALDPYGCPPLYNIIKHGRVELVRLLIEYGADVDQEVNNQEDWLRTPLILAVGLVQDEIVRALIINGANVNHIVCGGPSATLKNVVDAAVHIGNAALLQSVLDHGAITDWRSALATAYRVKYGRYGGTQYDEVICMLVQQLPSTIRHLRQDDLSNLYMVDDRLDSINKELDDLFAARTQGRDLREVLERSCKDRDAAELLWRSKDSKSVNYFGHTLEIAAPGANREPQDAWPLPHSARDVLIRLP